LSFNLRPRLNRATAAARALSEWKDEGEGQADETRGAYDADDEDNYDDDVAETASLPPPEEEVEEEGACDFVVMLRRRHSVCISHLLVLIE
jgi:hypothetical protein